VAKNILSVGFRFPGNFAEYVSLSSRRSLLDAHLIVFRPSVEPFAWVQDHYQGKRSLQDSASFELKDAASHWRQQIQLAVAAGKTVVVFLPELQEVFVDTGGRSYSGTGRNRSTTRHVEMFTNYRMLPTFAERIISADGKHMKLTEHGALLAAYWNEFGSASEYRVLFEGLKTRPFIETAGGLAAATMFSLAGGQGRVILLPVLAKYDVEPETATLYPDESSHRWSPADKGFGQKLVSALLSIDTAVRGESNTSPPPAWADDDSYTLEAERVLKQEILECDADIEALLAKRAELAKTLMSEGSLRRLLYEKGKPLEAAILEALRTLGLEAEPFDTSESEFDSVFVSAEGRFIGEAEGKDSKQIAIDKLRQLEMNIQEDFARAEVSEPARPVLFGNAFRLEPPAERNSQFFTDKCVTQAARTGTALVRTTDLFTVARIIRETGDTDFATTCRSAILQQGGRVVEFPMKQ